jgi:hypothetical protein
MKIHSLLVIAALALTACNQEEVPQEIVDLNMIISQRNAEFNATKFRNERFPDAVRVLMDSDSTISATCRFGDGWASGSLEMPDRTAIAIKCQTNGSGKGFAGCLTKGDFAGKSFADEDGICSAEIKSLPKFK